MSLRSIEAIESHLNGYKGIPLSEIKRRCEEFVRKRDDIKYKYANEKWVDVDRQSYAIRDGQKIERIKCQ